MTKAQPQERMRIKSWIVRLDILVRCGLDSSPVQFYMHRLSTGPRSCSGTSREDRVGAAERGENPMVLTPMRSGFAVIGDTQFLPGYCLLLASPQVDNLTDLPLERRGEFLLDMSLLGEAVEGVCRPRGLRRVNYEISGNREPFLHAHVWPRYSWEPEEYRSGPVGRYAREYRTDERYQYSDAGHKDVRAKIAAELLDLMDRTDRRMR